MKRVQERYTSNTQFYTNKLTIFIKQKDGQKVYNLKVENSLHVLRNIISTVLISINNRKTIIVSVSYQNICIFLLLLSETHTASNIT